MGPIGQLMSMIPGMGSMAKEAQEAVDRGDLKRTEAIIRSMTRASGATRPSSTARAGGGSPPAPGTTLPDVNRLVKQFARDAEAHEAAVRRRPTGGPRRADGPALSRERGPR